MAKEGNQAVKEAIVARIHDNGGSIPFADYMELCLYHPQGGYYQRSIPKLGKDGDFYTSAHVGTAMGQCIAAKLNEAAGRIAPDGETIAVVEWGGGDGRLSEAVLDELKRAFPDTYRLIEFLGVEGSPYHRKLQSSRLERHSDRIAGVVSPGDPLVDRMLREKTALVYANELLDAFPVHRLRYDGTDWQELFVEWDEGNQAFREQAKAIQDPRVAQWMERHPVSGTEGQTIELGLAGLDWIVWLGGFMRRGFVLLADYGDVSEELHASYRMEGTLLAYQNHTASGNPFLSPGEQDLTAHVNFEWCMEAAAAAGYKETGLCTQKQFLVEQGILTRLQNHSGADPFSPEAKSNRAIRQLLLSDGMSELFKVMTMYK